MSSSYLTWFSLMFLVDQCLKYLLMSCKLTYVDTFGKCTVVVILSICKIVVTYYIWTVSMTSRKWPEIVTCSKWTIVVSHNQQIDTCHIQQMDSYCHIQQMDRCCHIQQIKSYCHILCFKLMINKGAHHLIITELCLDMFIKETLFAQCDHGAFPKTSDINYLSISDVSCRNSSKQIFHAFEMLRGFISNWWNF